MEALMKQDVVGIPFGMAAFRPAEKSLKRLFPAPVGNQSPDGEPRAKQCREDAVVSRGKKVGSFVDGVRQHAAVRLGQKIRETVKGKLSLGAKILQVGGLRKGKQLFSLKEGEKLLKVVIPVGRIERVNQSKNVMKPSQKYLEIVTVDNFDFWFMGFQNFQKTFRFLQQEWKINC
ncbi:GEM-like protein 4, partial [Cucurbita argyrosperma subsp. argyrosperma]